MAERARAGLRRPLIERDDAVLRYHKGHQVGDGLATLGRPDLADGLRGDVIGIKRRSDIGRQWRCAAIECVGHRRAAGGSRHLRQQPCRADRHAGIARHRRHPQVQARVALLRGGKPGLVEMLQQPHVGQCIQGDAAGQHQAASTGASQ